MIKDRKIGAINISDFRHLDAGDLAIVYLFDQDYFAWLEDQYLSGREALMDTPENAAELARIARRLTGA